MDFPLPSSMVIADPGLGREFLELASTIEKGLDFNITRVYIYVIRQFESNENTKSTYLIL
jgi:hypothetical protein